MNNYILSPEFALLKAHENVCISDAKKHRGHAPQCWPAANGWLHQTQMAVSPEVVPWRI